MKIRALFCIAVIIAITAVGCATTDRSLTAAERDQIEDLLYSAKMSERFSDYNAAIICYQKIAVSFPESPYGKMAAKRVKHLKKKPLVTPNF